MNGIILFDGICNFCNQSVQFIIKRDPKAYFRFASLQSDKGLNLLQEHEIPSDLNSFILIERNKWYVKSSAALRVCASLRGAWKLCYFLLLIPQPIRDFFYDMIAKNRYKWFGKRESCMIPSPEERNRFL